MSGEIINLNKVRKAKARADKRRQADANRLLHGRSKTERERDASDEALGERRHAGHKRERSEDGDKP